MLTKAELKDILISNLTHKYMCSIQLYLTRLISRNVFSPSITCYRIKNLATYSYITTLDEFINAIDENQLSIGYDFSNSGEVNKGVTHPFYILLDNLSVELNTTSEEDYVYFNRSDDEYYKQATYGVTIKRIVFIMNYFGDQDSVLPLKVTDVKLF